MQANCALVELAGIVDAVDGFERIHRAGLAGIHFHRGCSFQFAGALIQVLGYHVEVFDLQASDGNGHPAILFAVIMDGTCLTDLPADGDKFVEGSLVDQVASVVLLVPSEIWRQGIGLNGSLLQECDDLVDAVESGLGEFLSVQLRNPGLERAWISLV